MKNKIIIAMSSVAVAGLIGIGIEESCIDDKGVMFFSDEELVLNELNDLVLVEKTGKICFKNKADYQKFKEEKITAYKTLSENQRDMYLLGEGNILDDILDKEIKKSGSIDLENYDGKDDIFLSIIDKLNL